MSRLSFWTSACLALLAWAGSSLAEAADYLHDVKPLLGRHCVKCHGASQQKSGLRIDTAAAALKGGKHGPLWVAGDPASSLLLQVLRGGHAEISPMPYKRPPLESTDTSTLEEWIRSGAHFPAIEEPTSDQHWAFIPPKTPEVPASGAQSAMAPNPIDAFILAKLKQQKLSPSPEANRRSLIRRVSLDLTGLPPAPEEVENFLRQHSPNAYEQLVDRLLASPHYGERWGRWWLDAARYADSNGYSIDSPRSIWPYRDWVVRALNTDLPFDQFTLWQLAGDLLRNPSLPAESEPSDPVIATGFHRNTQVNHEGGIDPEQFRIESVMDRVNTTATVWLGVTLACAQCHDHKFDPFTQRDYYQFLAYFNSCENDGHGNAALEAENYLELSPPDVIAARDAHRKELKSRENALSDWARMEMQPKQSGWEAEQSGEAKQALSQLVRDVLDIPASQRTKDQSNLVWSTFRNQHAEYRTRRKALDELKSTAPVVVKTLVMKEQDTPRETTVLIKGDFTRPGERVTAGTPSVLTPKPLVTEGSRLDLAAWITSAGNPLTARVLVNRVWQQYFGRGLVETENDFGTQGSPPTHPELLDWMATRFMSERWSMKALHRLIVTSRTYRQASSFRPELAERDPLNLWLARQNRLRLEAESIRDVMLHVSGLLDPRIGGPPVFPPQPSGLGAFTQNDRTWKTSEGPDRYRRALYTHLQRTSLYPALAVFDAADGYQTCTRRLRSNTPLQALTLLNDAALFEMVQAFAARIAKESRENSLESAIEHTFQVCLSRRPRPSEIERLLKLVQTTSDSATPRTSNTWLSVARVMMNLDETLTRE